MKYLHLATGYAYEAFFGMVFYAFACGPNSAVWIGAVWAWCFHTIFLFNLAIFRDIQKELKESRKKLKDACKRVYARRYDHFRSD